MIKITKLSPKIIIAPNEEKILLVDSLQSCTITLKKHSKLTLIALLQKGWNEKQTLNINFEGEESEIKFISIILGTNQEQFPFETISNHLSPYTHSSYIVRSAMFDKSKVDYKGNLIIKPKAKLSESFLEHHSLMLSKDAKVDTMPCLEIQADDVKAGHAATIGKVDEEILFYLASRGIDKRTAQSALIKGFLSTDLKSIPDESIQNFLNEKIEDSLEKLKINV